MRIENFKRWQWACIGTVLGLVISLWLTWLNADGQLNERATIDVTEFEQLILKKSASGQPLIKNIRYCGYVNGLDWITAEQLRPDRGAGERYIPVKIGAGRPYVARLHAPEKSDANFTILDYLRSVQAKDSTLAFSVAWWDQEPARSAIFAVCGLILFMMGAPAVMSFMGYSSGATPHEQADPHDSRLPRVRREEPTLQRQAPTESDLAQLRALEAEISSRLTPGQHRANAPAPSDDAIPNASTSAQPVRKLDAGPLEIQPEDKPKAVRQYRGQFYPTATHIKPEENP